MSSTAELSLGVIGLGRMAQALVQPLLELGELTPPAAGLCGQCRLGRAVGPEVWHSRGA